MACPIRWHTSGAGLPRCNRTRSGTRDGWILQMVPEHRQRGGDPAIVRDVLQHEQRLVVG